MIQYHKAVLTLSELARSRKIGNEVIPIESSVGRICALDVISEESVPPFYNSAMDGFAVHSAKTSAASKDHPIRLQVVGSIAAGDPITAPIIDRSLAVEIMTGAPIPEGVLDSVVKIEEVTLLEESYGKITEILVNRPLVQKENIRAKGEDFKPGQTVICSGNRVQPEHILAFASLGITRLSVKKIPKVGLISTGKELVSFSTHPEPGQIRNSTAPYLMATLPYYGVKPTYYGNIPDDEEKFKGCLESALVEGLDLVITTGAVSMGKHDFIPDVLKRLEARIHFHKVAIRPGKPILVADWPSLNSQDLKYAPVFFGIPGNPVSTAVGIRFFVEPYLRALLGLPHETPIQARIKNDFKKPEGLRCFFKAKLETHFDQSLVDILAGQASFMVSPLLKANAWAILLEDETTLRKGERVDVVPLYPEWFRRMKYD